MRSIYVHSCVYLAIIQSSLNAIVHRSLRYLACVVLLWLLRLSLLVGQMWVPWDQVS